MKGITMSGSVYVVENWDTEERIVGFPTEEARTNWLNKNTSKVDLIPGEYGYMHGYKFWKRVLNDDPRVRLAIVDY